MECSVTGVTARPSEARRDRIVRLCCRLTNYAAILVMVMLVARGDRYLLHDHIGLIALLIGIQVVLAWRFAKWRAEMFSNAWYVGLAGVATACVFVVDRQGGMLFFDLMDPGAQKAKLYFFVALLWALSGNRRETILTVLAAIVMGIVWKAGTLIGAALMAYLISVLAAYRWGAAAGRLPVTLVFLTPVAVGIFSPTETGAIVDLFSRYAASWSRVLIWEWSIWKYLDTTDAMKLLFGSGWRASFETPIDLVFHWGFGSYMPVGGRFSMHSSALTVLFDFGVAGLLALTGVLYYLMGRTYGDYLTTARMRAALAFFIVVCAVTLNFYYDYILIYLAFVVSIILCQRRAAPEFGRPG